MRRRNFIAGLGAIALPNVARAQKSGLPVVGFFHSESLDARRDYMAGFYQGLAETGFVEGSNVLIEYRWGEGHNDRLPSLAADLVQRRVTVIATPGSTPATLAAKAATQTIPIVFAVGSDPVGIGLVQSFNRPGGNLTGVSLVNFDVVGKRLELVHELAPNAALVAFLVNPANPVYAESNAQEAQQAARRLGMRLLVLGASNRGEIDAAFETMTREGVQGLVVSGDAFYSRRREQFAALATRHAMPTNYQYREFVKAGGLMSYGTSAYEGYRVVGSYVGRILKGEHPADLPLQQGTRIELAINMNAAKAINITFPLTILGRADEVIE